MYVITVIYHHPHDPAAFDEYYSTTHRPLAEAINGLTALSVSRCESLDESPPAEYVIARLVFATKDDALEGLSSTEGQAAAGDVANFATGGATMLFGEAPA